MSFLDDILKRAQAALGGVNQQVIHPIEQKLLQGAQFVGNGVIQGIPQLRAYQQADQQTMAH
jgi:hypothetical protein